ncbi:MAG: hypothetical protein ACREOZ_00600 [Gloeomargaritales cyanobacterium]
MLVSPPIYYHGCSTATRRDNDNDDSSAQEAPFIPITVSSVGRRHLNRKKSARPFKTYPKPVHNDGFFWRHPRIKVEPNTAWVRPRHSSHKTQREVCSLEKKAAVKLSSGNAVSKHAINEDVDSKNTIFSEAIKEMTIQNKFQREVRYLKAHHWFSSLPQCSNLARDRERMHRIMKKRKELIRQLRLIINQLGDNRKKIIIVSRREQCRVDSVKLKEIHKTRITGNNQRNKPVRRNGEVITERRSIGGRSPLPSGKCRTAAYHDPSIKTKVNGKTYHRQNGYITPVEDFLSVGTKVIMNKHGQHKSKQVWKSYQAHRKEVMGREEKQKRQYRDLRNKSKDKYGFSSSADEYVNLPQRLQTEETRELLIKLLENLHLNGNKSQHQAYPAASAAQGNLKDDFDSVHGSIDDGTATAGNAYDLDDYDSDDSDLPRNEWACMATVGNTTSSSNNGGITDRIRRLMSPRTSSNDAPLLLTSEDNLPNTARPSNISMEDQAPIADQSAGISPMSNSNNAAGDEEIVEETSSYNTEGDEDIARTTGPIGISDEDCKSFVSILHQLSAMSPGQDIRDIVNGVENRTSRLTGIAPIVYSRPTSSQIALENTTGMHVTPTMKITQEVAADSDSESDESDNSKKGNHLVTKDERRT